MNSKRIFLSPPHMGGEEMSFIKKAFESNYVAPLGPQVNAFEQEFSEYVGIKHCLAVSSGTAAMHLALRILGVEQTDSVIASTLTFIGSVTPTIFQGAELIFVDSDRESWNMDPDLLKEVLTNCEKHGTLPRAVVPTDLYGQCVNYERVSEICEEYEVPVVADAAEALGAVYYNTNAKSGMLNFDIAKQTDKKTVNELKIAHHAGTGAKAAVFSFNGNKIVTTSGGGMLASDDKDFIDYARKLAQQAREPFPHYEHTEIGYNYRMSNILAAIGRGQLKVLDERVKRKREIFAYYQDSLLDLPGIEFMPEPEWSRSNRWLTVILITPEEFGVDREVVRRALDAENIESRPVWKPMHLQPVFECRSEMCGDIREIYDPKSQFKSRKHPARVIGGKVAEDLFERGLCLPSGTAMTKHELKRVVDTILKCRYK